MRLLKAALVTFVVFALIACGNTSTTAKSGPTSYQAGVTIGDSGTLIIDKEALTYSLTIVNSSFGLAGQTLTGSITANPDGTYHVVGTSNGTIFVYPNYAIMTIKIDPNDPKFNDYFAQNPSITQATYVPVVALVESSLLTTVDQITSDGASFEFREASMGSTSAFAGGVPTYRAEASRGTITKISSTQFSVASCSNNGSSDQNSNLLTANCTGGLVSTLTFTYDSTSNAWLVTPVDTNHSSQVVRAYFVNDVMTNSVIGYVDTSDITKTSAAFAMVSIVPADTPLPTFSPNNTYTLTNYELCTSDDNCSTTDNEQGIFYSANVPFSTGTNVIPYSWPTDGPCIETGTSDSPVNGYISDVHTPDIGGTCTNSGDRPDVVGVMFGMRTINGKSVSMMFDIGYDSTVTNGPSQKMDIGYWSQN